MPLIEVNGLNYFFQVQGSGPPLLLLHGFSGSSANWQETVKPFSEQFQVILVDLPGHGHTTSPPDPERYMMEAVSYDLIDIIRTLKLPAVNLLGYSMGGRLALYTAIRHQAFVKSLIIESASPGLETAAQRQARIDSDNLLASEIEKNGIPAFIDRWQQLPIFATQQQLSLSRRASLRRQRLCNSASGLANSLRGMGTGRQPSLWPELDSVHLPLLIMAGELDQKYVRIAHRMVATIPQATLKIIAGAGHNIHLEKTQDFISIVLEFLQADHPGALK